MAACFPAPRTVELMLAKGCRRMLRSRLMRRKAFPCGTAATLLPVVVLPLLNASHQSCDQSCFQWRCCKMACGAVTFFPAIREGYSCICLKASFSSHPDEPAQLLPALRPLSAEGTHSDHFSRHVQLPAQAEKGLLWSICLPPPRRNATNHVNWCKATERPHHKCCTHES